MGGKIMPKIAKIQAYELLDSRSNPTVGVVVELSGGARGFAIVPSGASTGAYEACELRDKGSARYGGNGVKRAVNNVNGVIADCLLGQYALNQRKIDSILNKLDGTDDKSNLGANAILAVSLAVSKAAANFFGVPLYKYIGGIGAYKLPQPMMNILNGGAHAKNNVDIQEFMIVPSMQLGFSEALRIGSEIYKTLSSMLIKLGKSVGVGDEGGFAPDLKSDEEAIELLCDAIEKSGYSTDDVKIALDIAASEWYQGDGIYLKPKSNLEISTEGLIDMYKNFVAEYPVISIEDGLSEDDWQGWGILTKALGRQIQLVGDDIFVTNVKRLKKGIDTGVANSILIKPNQIGTLTETLDVIYAAKSNGYNTVISHRSGETEDTTIADIAVGVNAGQIKTGAPCRSERVAKYNRLLLIENELYK